MDEQTPIATYPDRIGKPELRGYSPQDTKATVVWDDQGCEKYYVRRWVDGEEPSEKQCPVPMFTINDLRPGGRYNIQVAACITEDDTEKCGRYSEVLTFQSGLKKPTDLFVQPGRKSPDTSFIVKFNYQQLPGIEHEVFYRSLTTGEIEKVKADLGFAKIENLTPGDTYDIWVVASKEGDKSELCKLEDPIQSYPGRVEGLEIDKTSPTSQILIWKPVFGANSYLLKKKRCDGNYETIPTLDTELTLPNLNSGQAYKVCVAAVNSAGEGKFSEAKIFTTDLSPPRDICRNAIYTGSDVSLEVKYTGSDQEINKYVITATSDSGDSQTKEEESYQTLFSNLNEGHYYTVSVQAVSTNGVESKKVYAEPIWIRPGSVTNLKSQAVSGNSERVYWDDVEGSESYCIFVEKDGISVEHKRNVPEITLTNLTLNKRFSVTVMAVNVAGSGKISKPVNFMTALSPPEDLKTSNIPHYRESGILVFWKGCDDAVEYEVDLTEVATNHVIPRKTTKKCSYEFYDLKPSSEYRASVRCISNKQNRNSTLAQSETIWTYCPKVGGMEATYISSNTYTLKWNPIPSARGYKLSYKPTDGNFTVIDSTASHKTIRNLQLGMLYIAHVTAINGAGEGQESEPVEFRTGMMPPVDLEVSNNLNNPSTSINCTIIEPQNKPSFYQARAIAVSIQHRSEIQRIDTDLFMTTIRDLTPSVQYLVQAWSVYEEDEKLNSEKVLSTKIWTRPRKISNIQVHKDSTNSQFIEWEEILGATSYNVQLKKKGSAPVTQSTDANNIHFEDLELNCQYTVSVKALNPGGSGKESEKISFETALHPVQSVRVENSTRNPTTELIVRLEGSVVSPTSKYKLRFINLNEGTFNEIIKSGNIIKMSELHEGTKYQVGVTSVHETDEKLNSEEILSDPISTVAPSLVVETMSISHEEQKFMWSKIDNVLEYVFHWRIEHRGWQQETLHQDEFILGNLEPGKKYEVYVTAINDSGEGDWSSTVQFDTVPPVPTDLQQQILSTQEFKISCKSCEGADGYIFKVNNKSFNSELPEYTLQSQDLVDIEVTVQSYNTAGESRLSNVLKFRQVVSLLQQKFKQVAENLLNKSAFVTPKLIKIPSGDVIGDLELQATQIKEGDTVMIIGENFTGKTACCKYFLQHVPNAKLAFYFDYEDVKALKTKLNVKAILHKYMPDLPEEEIDFVFHWMKNNSNQVVFVVDNFNLSPEFNPRNLLYKNEGLPNQIFYNLLVTNRQVFPKSQVFCSTSHDSVKQFLNPTLSVKIYGFDDTGIINMKKNILGEKNDIADVPEVFQFFCANPGFCESILYMIKNNEIEADIDSFSSVLVQLILKNLKRYPLVQKKVKINHLWQKINEVPKRIEAANINPEKVKKRKDRSNSQSQVATSVMESSINSGGLSFLEDEERSVVSRKSSINCDVLQDYITIAMYFAFFCKLDDFKKRLRKKSLKFGSFAKIWIMIAGLLREETMKTAKKIFEPADIVIDEREVLNKCEVVKKFIKDYIGNILNQIYIEPQITLDWFSICNELNDEKLLLMCEKKIEITDKTTTDEVEKAAEFLRRLAKKFCSNVRVKYVCDDAAKTLSIDNAIRENPNKDLILVKSEGSKSINPLKRKSSKYQRRSETDNQMSPTSPMDNGFPEINEDAENTSLVMDNQHQQGPDFSAEPDANSINSHDAPMNPLNNQNDLENPDIQNGSEDSIGID